MSKSSRKKEKERLRKGNKNCDGEEALSKTHDRIENGAERHHSMG